MSEYFARVANEVLRASEEITTIMEDGIAAMIRGEVPGIRLGEPTRETIHDQDLADIDEENVMMDSPLMGIADSVIGDLMKNSVSFIHSLASGVFDLPET